MIWIAPTLLAFSIVSGLATADDRPNIVILFADDLGYGELGCQGNPEIPTPHIDSIAEAGIRFTNGYVSAPNCSPSRAGLLTGKYQTRFGYEFNPVGARNENPQIGLPRSERTIAEILQRAGYTTGLIGKWHLGGTAEYHPRRRGFDEFFGFLHEGHFFVPPPWRGVTTMLRRQALPDGSQGRWEESESLVYSTHMGQNEPPYDANNPILRDGQPVTEEMYLTDAFTRESLDFIDRHKDKPFFLYLSYNAVHSPLQAKNADMEPFSQIEDVHRRIFSGMLASLDNSVGAVLDKIRGAGLEQTTLIFFLSDNGGPTRELTSSNAPLRGEKSQVYEGGLRVPFLVQWKGQLPAGKTYQEPVISLDIFATALAAAGLPLPEGIDGVNLLPYLKEEANGSPHDTLYWRQGPRTALLANPWKLLTMDGGKRWELYHLEDDISESQDLAEVEPDQLEKLKQIWERLDGEMAEPRF